MKGFTERCLNMQGFDELPSGEEVRYAAMLRWTPAACTSLVVTGLVLQSPLILGATAAFALFGSLMPAAHPLDVFYNLTAARVLRTGPLPPSPAPRRFAAGIKSLPLGFAAVLMQVGQWQAATVIGAALAVVGIVAAATCWDLGSWMYRRLVQAMPVVLTRVLAPAVVRRDADK